MPTQGRCLVCGCPFGAETEHLLTIKATFSRGTPLNKVVRPVPFALPRFCG